MVKGLNKVMIIGSGPIVIGQAAEFDYAGTQACKSLKEEGIEVVLLNSNPATIMTDPNIADKLYIEPMTLEACEKIISQERPDAILATLGGQTGLNMAVELEKNGVLKKYGVKLLGTTVEAIENSEDREKFKNIMEQIGESVADGDIFEDVQSALDFANSIGYPIIVRPAYTLGGTGGGIAHNEEELKKIAYTGIKASIIGQILVEKSLLGYKEIEYEVMRDKNDNCITICNMENIDPVGVHTGDSIVVAPSQTLSDKQYQMLRSASINIIRNLKIEGGCNVQFALDPTPNSDKYYVIEVNPRVSRSSALASKVTGYPIAKMAAKIAVGKTLDEIKNPITGKTACFEPSLDYVVVKMPRWPFDKFKEADNSLGTQMKATGEVMAIDVTFEGAFMKALYSLELRRNDIKFSEEKLESKLEISNSERIFWIMWALDNKYPVKKICELTAINKWFVEKINNISHVKHLLKETSFTSEGSKKLIILAKKYGITDAHIAMEMGTEAKTIREYRIANDIVPKYRMVDTCAGEFKSDTPYYYSAYTEEDEVLNSDSKKVIILGSGPIRIGQGIEFDYSCVHCAWALKAIGVEAIMINNNPETVSTDFDTASKLYFEPLTLESVLNIVDKEKPIGVIAQFGGQTALNLIKGLERNGVRVLGTAVEDMDKAEDREKFEKLLEELDIPKPYGKTAFTRYEAEKIVNSVGYPALIRPSYVIGGQAMAIIKNQNQFEKYIDTATRVSPSEPVLIDRYIEGKETEIDAVCNGEEFVIVGIMEHIERAGVHSGDSMACYPHRTLTDKQVNKIIEYSKRIALKLKIKGLINIQYVIDGDNVFVIEVNPRASRTVPILSKVTGIDMIYEGTISMLNDFGYKSTLFNRFNTIVDIPKFKTVKAPVFSSEKLKDADMSLGPQMKSTGEVMGMDENFEVALMKAFIAAGIKLPKPGKKVLVSLNDKREALMIIKAYKESGFSIIATEGTANKVISDGGVNLVDEIISKSELDIIEQRIKDENIVMVINTSKGSKNKDSFGSKLRSIAISYRIPCITSIDTASALLNAIKTVENTKVVEYKSLEYYGNLGGTGYEERFVKTV